MISRLDAKVDGLVLKEQSLARELEAMTAKAEQERANAELEKGADRLAAKLRELVLPSRLRTPGMQSGLWLRERNFRTARANVRHTQRAFA